MSEYLFIFGRTPELAWQELFTLDPTAVRISESVAQVMFAETTTTTAETSFPGLFGRLGGVVKAARLVLRTPVLEAEKIMAIIDRSNGPVDFGISLFGTTDLTVKQLVDRVKSLLTESGVKARYRLSRHGDSLSSVTVDKSHTQDIVVVNGGKGNWLIGKTEMVQDYGLWNARDYGRPAADPKLGMLPVKVSRMLVNLAVGDSDPEKETPLVLDPFCGMGTILQEAMAVGAKVIGSDIDAGVIGKAKRNLTWYAGKFPEIRNPDFLIYQADATHISGQIADSSVNAIVTEPYLGPTALSKGKMTAVRVRNIFKGLDKLYLGCLREWHRLLVPGGHIVICLPSTQAGNRPVTAQKAIDTCERLGYTKVLGPITYAREHAVVKRDIYKLRKV